MNNPWTLLHGKKNEIIAVVIISIVLTILVVLFIYSRVTYHKARAKCPDYTNGLDKIEGFGPGLSDESAFIDCGGNLIVVKRRNIYAPNPEYVYVVENYQLETNGTWPKVIVSSDRKGRFAFSDQQLYVYSTIEEKPKYYILDINTGAIKNVYENIDNIPESEWPIFAKLSKSHFSDLWNIIFQ